MNFKIFSFLLCLFSIFSLNAQDDKSEAVFKLVDEPPRFYSEECENYAGENLEKTKECAQQQMLNFIYRNIQYPLTAVNTDIEGTVVIRFVVGKDGQLQNAECIRSIGGGCDEAALRVVKMMDSWVPGIQDGENVPVYFNLPIKFALEGKKKKKKRKKQG